MDAVREYIAAIAPENRALFDRINGVILEVHPDAEVVMSYGMPRYKVGARHLYVGAWKHGVSLYGWDKGRVAGFVARHQDLVTGKGTIRLRPDAAAGISDAELRDLVRGALGD